MSIESEMKRMVDEVSEWVAENIPGWDMWVLSHESWTSPNNSNTAWSISVGAKGSTDICRIGNGETVDDAKADLVDVIARSTKVEGGAE